MSQDAPPVVVTCRQCGKKLRGTADVLRRARCPSCKEPLAPSMERAPTASAPRPGASRSSSSTRATPSRQPSRASQSAVAASGRRLGAAIAETASQRDRSQSARQKLQGVTLTRQKKQRFYAVMALFGVIAIAVCWGLVAVYMKAFHVSVDTIRERLNPPEISSSPITWSPLHSGEEVTLSLPISGFDVQAIEQGLGDPVALALLHSAPMTLFRRPLLPDEQQVLADSVRGNGDVAEDWSQRDALFFFRLGVNSQSPMYLSGGIIDFGGQTEHVRTLIEDGLRLDARNQRLRQALVDRLNASQGPSVPPSSDAGQAPTPPETLPPPGGEPEAPTGTIPPPVSQPTRTVTPVPEVSLVVTGRLRFFVLSPEILGGRSYAQLIALVQSSGRVPEGLLQGDAGAGEYAFLPVVVVDHVELSATTYRPSVEVVGR